jgi:hypothetical protein
MSRKSERQFALDVTTVGDMIGSRPVGDDNEYDDARRVLRSDWLAARDRENRAIGWDEGYVDATTWFAAHGDSDSVVPAPASRNPYRGDNR